MILALILSLRIGESCNLYICNKKEISMSPSTCIYFAGNTYYMQSCSDSDTPYCAPTFGITNVTCAESPSKSKPTAYPGEYCSGDNECVYGFCYNFRCTAQAIGGGCTTHLECNPGLMCKDGECEEQIEVNSSKECSEDFECVNNAGCNGTNCTAYLSVPNNNWVHSCGKDGRSLLCASGFCLNGYCLEAPKSHFTYGATCKDADNSNCYSSDFANDGIVIHSDCVCGMNPLGQEYCDIFVGDPPYQNMLKYTQKWVLSKNMTDCNTARRWESGCLDSAWNQDDASAFAYYTTMSLNYPRIQMIDDCAIDIIHPGFREEAGKIGDFGLVLTIGILYYFV